MPVYFPDSYCLVRARDALSAPDGFRSYDAVADYPAKATEMLLSGRKKDETRGWELLPARSRVEAVMAYQPQEKHLAFLAQMPGLRRLGLLTPKMGDFSVLAAAKKLEVLFIEDAANLESLTSLAGIRSLRALGIFDAKRLKDLSGLEAMPHLKELAIQCGVWNALKVRTLQPLAGLTKLEVLSLHAEVGDHSFEPVRRLTSLKELGLNLQCPYDQMAKLSAFLPTRICPYFAEPFATVNTCPKGANHNVIVPAKGGRKFCKDCHPAKLDEYLAEFNRIRDEARRRGKW